MSLGKVSTQCREENEGADEQIPSHYPGGSPEDIPPKGAPRWGSEELRGTFSTVWFKGEGFRVLGLGSAQSVLNNVAPKPLTVGPYPQRYKVAWLCIHGRMLASVSLMQLLYTLTQPIMKPTWHQDLIVPEISKLDNPHHKSGQFITTSEPTYSAVRDYCSS